jgi:predicted DNA-binding transcriptional regulator YafY
MAAPTARVLALLELLQTHRRMTVGELAARLSVDERTVRRYAATLAELGIPVTAERGRYGGYRLLPGFKLPPLMLTDDEAVAVLLGLVAADRAGLTADAPAAATAEAKITRVLPARLAERLTALRASLGFTQGTPSPAAGPSGDLLLTLAAATRAHERVALAYADRAGAASEREFDPYGLVFHAARWYLVGLDHRSGEIRTFRADRVAAVRGTGTVFPAPDDFDAVAHLNRVWATRDYAWRVEVLLRAEPDEVRRRVPAAVAELTPVPEGTVLSCRAERLAGMAQMLAGLGWPFTVIEPPELRAEVVALAARLRTYAEQ